MDIILLAENYKSALLRFEICTEFRSNELVAVQTNSREDTGTGYTMNGSSSGISFGTEKTRIGIPGARLVKPKKLL